MGCQCPIVLIIRVVQLFFSLVVLAITSNVIHKFSEARQLNDDLNILGSFIRDLIDHILSTPQRVYFGMFVSLWALLATVYIIFAPRWRNAKLAPPTAIISIEITTAVLWFCASIALALFAAEVEPICLAVEDVPILRKVIQNCIILKISTGVAALSWLLWLITFIIASVQACRLRRKNKTPAVDNGRVTEPLSYWTPARSDVSKAEQGFLVTTIEMQSQSPITPGYNVPVRR